MWRYTSTPPYALLPCIITVIVLESGDVFMNIQLVRLCKMTLGCVRQEITGTQPGQTVECRRFGNPLCTGCESYSVAGIEHSGTWHCSLPVHINVLTDCVAIWNGTPDTLHDAVAASSL